MKLRIALFARLLLLVFLLGNQWCGLVSASAASLTDLHEETSTQANQAAEAGQWNPPATLLWQPESTRLSTQWPDPLGRKSGLLQSAVFLTDSTFSPALPIRRSPALLCTGECAGLTLLLQHSRLQL